MAEDTYLNSDQRQAVEHGSGPLMILAGAGSGKTRVIVHRIVHLVRDQRVPAGSIVGVTFTNKAAGEMVSRVARLLPDPTSRPTWISTFHSLCARILRREAPVLGLPRSFTIFDEDDQVKMLKEIAGEMNLPQDGPSVASYQAFVERARNRGWLPRIAFESGSGHQHELYAQVYEHYHQRMRANATLDFGDLILAVIECLCEHPHVRQRYLVQWQHLLVDEFQDTNPAQYQLLKLLTQAPYNVTVVGDDDQSIYAWRGATVENLLGFQADFPGCRVVRLEQNYRSTQAILDAANAAIAANHARMPKVLWTENQRGTKPIRFTGRDEREEASYIVQQIGWMRRAHGLALGDIALFYRTNAQSRIYEEQLRAFAIPYRIIAGTSFYAREEIKDILAYLRLAINPGDDVAAMRIANVPRRGLGSKGLDQVRILAHQRGTSFFTALEEMLGDGGAGFRKKTRDALEHWCAVIHEVAAAASRLPPADLTLWLVDQVAYRAHLEAVHPENAAERYENVQELVSAMRDFEEESALQQGSSPGTLQGFLEKSALVQAADDQTAADAVNLMTIHAAKGLEFPVVFLTGLEDGLLPLVRSGADEPENLEEERRLFYVAITRAKDRLYLTDCLTRRLFGNALGRRSSRFLEVIDEDLLQRDPLSYRRFHPDTIGLGMRGAKSATCPPVGRPAVPTREVGDLVVPPDGLRLRRPLREDGDLEGLVGRTARHKTFGDGRIIRADYSGQRIKLTIVFPSVGTKCVIRSFVQVL